MDIHTTLLTSLRRLAQQQTEETLGDRRDYLGASDIGYCPRKVIFERLHASEHDLATLLRFARGHMVEDIIAKAFSAAGFTNYERQVEIILPTTSPVKAHVDFVFTSTSHKIKSVLEVKSTNTIPDHPYGSWESQLYLQLGGLKHSYPEYNVKGAILALDLAQGEVAFFNGYTPQDTIFNGLMRRAEMIWSDYQLMVQGETAEPATDVSPLCGFCHHLADCPRFAAQDVPQLASSIEILQKLQDKEKTLKEKTKELKQQLLLVVEQKGTIRSGDCIIRKVTRNRKYLNLERLENFLSQSGESIGAYQEDRSFSFLEVKKIEARAA